MIFLCLFSSVPKTDRQRLREAVSESKQQPPFDIDQGCLRRGRLLETVRATASLLRLLGGVGPIRAKG